MRLCALLLARLGPPGHLSHTSSVCPLPSLHFWAVTNGALLTGTWRGYRREHTDNRKPVFAPEARAGWPLLVPGAGRPALRGGRPCLLWALWEAWCFR